MAIDREYAKYELQHALLDGVFAPTRKVKDGELRLRKIEAYYDYPDPKTGVLHKRAIYLKLLVPYSLNPQAESILLAIIKQSGLHGIRNKELHIEPTQPTLPFQFDTGNTAIAAFLFDIEDGGSAREKPVAIAVISQYQLLKDAGMGDSKDSYRLLRQYLEQMSNIRVSYRNNVTGWFGTDSLIGFMANDDGRLITRLNWRLTGAIFGDYLYAEIDLKERHTLKKDASKTLHRWLSAHLWAGKSGYMLYETLITHIWTDEAAPAAQRKRLERLKREILPELANLPGWKIETGEKGAHITHLKLP